MQDPEGVTYMPEGHHFAFFVKYKNEVAFYRIIWFNYDTKLNMLN